MVSWLLLIAFCVTAWHIGSLIVRIFLCKIFFLSPIGVARMITSPKNTMRSAKENICRIGHHFLWSAGGIFVICLIVR